MSDQIEMLGLQENDLVLDLGCGTGSLATQLFVAGGKRPRLSRVVGLDHIPEALLRARKRAVDASGRQDFERSWLAADLNVSVGAIAIPFRSETFDAVLASLLLSYLERPKDTLSEIFRLLRPGGRIVVSSLLKDADISRLYMESVAELQLTDTAEQLPELRGIPLDKVARNFLNDASRILDLEAEGSFIFWEAEQLRDLLKSSGFDEVEARTSFGNPGQAVVVRGRRPI